MALRRVRVDAAALAGLRLTSGFPLALRERIAAALEPLHLAGGEWLFHQGDPGESLFLVGSGRLEVVRSVGGSDRVVATLQAGDTVGELALLEGGTRAAGVRALRDSDLHVLHRDDVALLLADAHFAGALLSAITRIVRAEPVAADPATRHTVIAFVGQDPVAVADLVDAVAASLTDQHVRTAVLRAADVPDAHDPGGTRSGRLLDDLEHSHDVVLLDGSGLAGRGQQDGRAVDGLRDVGDVPRGGGWADGAPRQGLDSPWARTCARQADRVVVVGGETVGLRRQDRSHLQGCDLVIPGDARLPTEDLDRWAHLVAPRAHHRLRPGHRRRDTARLARRLTGRALGLVLSGGGARGLAHIGVLQAVEEAGLVIDRFGGTSMGAFISALAATGRTSGDVLDVARREVVTRQPFRDYTVPRVALIRGLTAERMLRRLFGDVDVRHLSRSWFGVSAALDDAELVVHRHGPVWEAIACSMSLPGLAPPRIWEGRIVVDGGVLDNLPVGVMAADDEGQVIAADVTRERMFGGGAGGQPRLPGIVETLSATMGLSSMREGERSRRLARVMIDPEVTSVDLLDFRQIDRAVSAGLAAGRQALADAKGLLPPRHEKYAARRRTGGVA